MTEKSKKLNIPFPNYVNFREDNSCTRQRTWGTNLVRP